MTARTVRDRRVHARSDRWVIVRYSRSGKWYLEWIAKEESPPPSVGEGGWIRAVTSTGRVLLTVHDAVVAAVGLGLAHDSGVPGGATFDRQLTEYRGRYA